MTMPLSWSMRFALALCAVFTIGTLVTGGLSYVFLSREMTLRLAADTRASAESLARLAADGGLDDLKDHLRAQILSVRDGSSLVAYVDATTGETLGSLDVAPFEGPRRLVVGADMSEAETPGFDAPEAYQAYGIRIGDGWVIAARDEAWVAENGEILVQTLAWALAIGLLLSVALAVIFARRNERRITAMEEVLEAAGTGRLDLRIQDPGKDDLAELAARVDQMLARLETGVAAIRQVSTDVAHDLRAPLTRLRMRLEPQALSSDVPEATRHEIGSALVDLDAISATFDAILRLSRLQSGTIELRSDAVDLCRLGADICDLLGPSAEDAGHVLTADLPNTPVVVRGDADLLSQALSNLVDNALRHCPAPAHVTLTVTEGETGPVLTVRDNGPGIPEADRERVFDRFVRLDASRSVPGTGLGLSLVAAIATLHGARIVVEDAAPGLAVRLVFPKVPA